MEQALVTLLRTVEAASTTTGDREPALREAEEAIRAFVDAAGDGSGTVATRGGDRGYRIAAYGVIVEAGRILLCRLSERAKDPGQWTLPGGGLEGIESPREAATREILEETGFRSRVEQLICVDRLRLPASETIEGYDFDAVRLLYRAEIVEGSLQSEEAGTTERAAWLSRQALPDTPVVDVVELALHHLGWER